MDTNKQYNFSKRPSLNLRVIGLYICFSPDMSALYYKHKPLTHKITIFSSEIYENNHIADTLSVNLEMNFC